MQLGVVLIFGASCYSSFSESADIYEPRQTVLSSRRTVGVTVFWRTVLWAVMKLHRLSPTTSPLGRALVLVDLRDVAVLYAPPFCCAADPTQPLTGVHWVLDTGLGVQEVVNSMAVSTV
ncbi:hypothetical protein FOXG_17573 [Fusarium oxysporum f. sp. lycopersici 4287]|uniref:Uncharacterized protein n=2 Tax=Fusarium oxysporum TaxID=5507 RepID=A0A0J9WCI8_FUSO4|nr:uncharacterized protein FOXG_17573 [Fusarium oxysporum f. sp. lycopersici 4287]KNB20588.1 hypothetical protein FOXG_17573 [Fusarium oxysporum f. sp. lycopersici 4287]